MLTVHEAGGTEAPIGRPATMVYATSLSEQAVLAAVRAGHTYVKTAGTAGPNLSLTAKRDAGGAAVMMGDSITGRDVQVTATISNSTDGKARILELQRNGVVVKQAPVLTPTATITLPVTQSGRYNIVVERKVGAGVIDAVSSPIYVTVPPANPAVSVAIGGVAKKCVKPKKTAKVTVTTTLTDATLGSVALKLDKKKLATVKRSPATVTIAGSKLKKPGKHTLTAQAMTQAGLKSTTVSKTITVCKK